MPRTKRRPDEIITEDNIFFKDLNITTARRELLENLTSVKDIQDYAEEYQNILEQKDKITTRVWRKETEETIETAETAQNSEKSEKLETDEIEDADEEDDIDYIDIIDESDESDESDETDESDEIDKEPIGLIGDYAKSRLPLISVLKSASLVYEHIWPYKISEPVKQKNIFVRDKAVENIAEKIVRAVYIPNRLGVVGIQRGEWYDVIWSSIHVKFEDIFYLKKRNLLKRMVKKFREKFPDIYKRELKSFQAQLLANPTAEQDTVPQPSTSGLQSSSRNMSTSNVLLLSDTREKAQKEGSSQMDPSSGLPGSSLSGPCGKKSRKRSFQSDSEIELIEIEPALDSVNSVKESLKKELSNYFALALTVFHHNNDVPDEDVGEEKEIPLFLVIMAHFIKKYQKDYHVETRLLTYEEIADDSIKITQDKFAKTIEDYGLVNKYLVIVSRENLKFAFSGDQRKWLQCSEEILDSCVFTSNAYTNGLVFLMESMKKSKPAKKSYNVLLGKSKSTLVLSNKKLANYTKVWENFVEKLSKSALSMLDDFSASQLLIVWSLMKKKFGKPDLSSGMSESLEKFFDEKMTNLDPIQLTACFLHPFHLKLWMNKDISDECVSTKQHEKLATIKGNLMEFEKLIPETQTDANLDEESQSERPPKRRKRLEEKVNLLLGSLFTPAPKTLETEIDDYIFYVNKKENFRNFNEYEFWEDKLIHLPKLKQAALFYLSIPATILPSVLLLETALNEENVNGDSDAEKLFMIINKEFALNGENNKTNVDKEIAVADIKKNLNDSGKSSETENVNDSTITINNSD